MNQSAQIRVLVSLISVVGWGVSVPARDQPLSLPPGCKVEERSDRFLVAAYCSPSLDGRYSGGGIYRFPTKDLVSSPEQREVFARALNAFSGVPLRPADAPETLLLDPDVRGWFAEKLFEARNSSAWSDGMRYAAMDILQHEALQPDGARFLAEHVVRAIDNSDISRVRLYDLAFFITKEALPAKTLFETIAAKGPREITGDKYQKIRLLAAIGLARQGSLARARELTTGVIATTRICSSQQDSDIETQAKAVLGLLDQIPEEPSILFDWMNEHFQVEFM